MPPDEPVSKHHGTPPPVDTRWQPGQSGNPAGSSKVLRFKAAVLRQLKKLQEDGDTDELDVVARRFVQLVRENDKSATRLLTELWAREDGPLETRLAGPHGEALQIQVTMELHDSGSARTVEPSEADAKRATTGVDPTGTCQGESAK